MLGCHLEITYYWVLDSYDSKNFRGHWTQPRMLPLVPVWACAPDAAVSGILPHILHQKFIAMVGLVTIATHLNVIA